MWVLVAFVTSPYFHGMRNILALFVMPLLGLSTPWALGQQVHAPAAYEQLKLSGALRPGIDVVAGDPWPAVERPRRLWKGGLSECDCWIEPDSTYLLAMPPTDDGSSLEITLPFNFQLFGVSSNQVYINNNGNITLGGPLPSYSAAGFPFSGADVIAPFWADVDTRPSGGGQVFYKLTPTALLVNWVAVGHYNQQTDRLNSFQAILTDGNDPLIGIGRNVAFCYLDMQWTTGDASGGAQGFDGSPATVGVNDSNSGGFFQVGRFNQPGDHYAPAIDTSGVAWLNGRSFAFDLSTSPQNRPPAYAGTLLCATRFTCVGDPNKLEFFFTAPEASQLCFITATAPSLSNFQVEVTQPGLLAYLRCSFTPTVADIGLHDITLTATDTHTPPGATTYTFQVGVDPADDAGQDGYLLLCDNALPEPLASALGGPFSNFGSWYAPGGAYFGSTSVLFDPQQHAPGIYLHVVDNNGCPSDTAAVEVDVEVCSGLPVHGTQGWRAMQEMPGVLLLRAPWPLTPHHVVRLFDARGRELAQAHGSGASQLRMALPVRQALVLVQLRAPDGTVTTQRMVTW